MRFRRQSQRRFSMEVRALGRPVGLAGRIHSRVPGREVALGPDFMGSDSSSAID